MSSSQTRLCLSLTEAGYIIAVALHVIAVAVGIGAVTVTDYLHVSSLRNKTLEKRLVIVYPLLAKLIALSLVAIYLTGIKLVSNNMEVLQSPLFRTKIALVILVTINGAILHKYVLPKMRRCIQKSGEFCSKKLLYVSSFTGGLSVVSWYSILFLSLTKEIGYSYQHFLVLYSGAIVFAFIVALFSSDASREWV